MWAHYFEEFSWSYWFVALGEAAHSGRGMWCSKSIPLMSRIQTIQGEGQVPLSLQGYAPK